MELISWSPLFSVKVQVLDQQHQKLLGFINTLFNALEEHQDKHILEKVLFELIEYTKYHFESEEAFLKETNYPGFEEQRSAHQQLIAQVEEFFDQLKNLDSIKVELFNFLKGWLTTHILGMDKKYSHHLNMKGIH